MKIAFQMDPIGPIDIRADSTFRLMLEAQAQLQLAATAAALARSI